jgi:hypothetical protein
VTKTLCVIACQWLHYMGICRIGFFVFLGHVHVWNIKVTSTHVVLVYHIYSNGGAYNSNFVKYIAGIVDIFFTYLRYSFFLEKSLHASVQKNWLTPCVVCQNR